MRQYDSQIRLVRELKGAALSILVLLAYSPVPVTQKWLEIHSGYSDKPVSDALYYLREHGYVFKQSKGWLLNRGTRQLILPTEAESIQNLADQTDRSHLASQEQESQPVEDPQPDNSDQDGQGRKLSDSPSNSINKESFKEDSINTITSDTRNITDSIEEEKEKEVIRAFDDCGLRVNGRTMPLIPQLTGSEVRSAWRELYVQGRQQETGILVTILEDLIAKRQRMEYDRGARYKEWEQD
jgi:hypothetical protein